MCVCVCVCVCVGVCVCVSSPSPPPDSLGSYLCSSRCHTVTLPTWSLTARVAAGQCDGAFDQGLNAWDVAAGSLLITEAGGCIGNFLGAADFLESREYMAAGPRLFAEMGAALRCYSRFDR